MKEIVINGWGTKLDYEAAVILMDDDLREEIHRDLAPCSAQEFFSEYERRHFEKFGEEWELSKKNPTW